MSGATRCVKLIRPRLVIFDLDRTLWPFGIDEYVFKPPYRKEGSRILDRVGKEMKPFPEVDAALRSLHMNGVDLAVASRTTFPDGAYSLLKLFNWDDLIRYREIYPGSKVMHFKNLASKTRYKISDMIFFDDEQRNIDDAKPLGLTSILVNPETGITLRVINEGLEQFSREHAAPANEE